MRKKTTSQVICENFKVPAETIFQDYKCTYRASLTFFGRLYVGEEHFLFIANMFGIVKKCAIGIDRVTKIDEQGPATILVAEKVDGQEIQYVFSSFKNDNAYKLMRGLWKGEKIGSDVLKNQNQEQSLDSQDSMKESIHLLDEGHVEANFFDPRNVETQRQKIVEISLPCSVTQFYDFFLADSADVYSRRRQLEKRGSHTIVISPWKQNTQLQSDVREVSAMVKVTGVPFLKEAHMSQVSMLKRNLESNQIENKVITQMGDVPYCTYFQCEEVFKVISDGEKKCKLIIEAGIVFNKSTYMKNTIISKTLTDLKDEYQLWHKTVKGILEDMRKKRESSDKGKKVDVEYEQNLPVNHDSFREVPASKVIPKKSLTLEQKVDILLKLVGILLVLNIVQILYSFLL